MSTNNSNHLVNPAAREAMDKFKMEAAADPAVPRPSRKFFAGFTRFDKLCHFKHISLKTALLTHFTSYNANYYNKIANWVLCRQKASFFDGNAKNLTSILA